MLFRSNFYAEYIMRNAGLEEAQAGIKISRRNINNLRYADDTTLMAENEEPKLYCFFFHIKVCNSSRMYCCVIVNWEDFDFIFFYMDTQ